MKKRKRWLWVLIILIVIAVSVSFLLNGRQAVRYAQDTAITGNISTFYNFSGSVDVTNSVKVTSPVNAKILEVYVQANTQVAENARLLRLDDGTIIKADIAGEVTSLSAEAGNAVLTGDKLLEIMDLSSMKATFQVDEYDISAVTAGKNAEITIDGTGASFNAPITALDMRAVQSGDLSYYVATVDLRGTTLPADLLPGMQISVNVSHQQAENAVMLRIGSISFNQENMPFVYMQVGKDIQKIPVEVGINDGIHVQILSGVKAGDTILYVPTSDASLQEMMAQRSDNFTSGAQ